MNIEEKARKFAEGKAMAALDQAIREAYAEGYRDGYKDREEEIPLELLENKTEFVDLGLPSGTLWASAYETCDGSCLRVPFDQAKKYQLPTKTQYQELIDYCKWDVRESNNNFNHFIVIGPNGNYIKLVATGYEIADRLNNWTSGYFWLNNEEEEDSDTIAAAFWSSCKQTQSIFSGYKLPIHQVR
jgi:hypothetical protein